MQTAIRTEGGLFFVPWPQFRPPGADEKVCVNMVSDGLMERGTGFRPCYHITDAGRVALEEELRLATVE